MYKKVCFLLNKDLSNGRSGVKLRVTENRCVVFDFPPCVYLTLVAQH